MTTTPIVDDGEMVTVESGLEDEMLELSEAILANDKASLAQIQATNQARLGENTQEPSWETLALIAQYSMGPVDVTPRTPIPVVLITEIITAIRLGDLETLTKLKGRLLSNADIEQEERHYYVWGSLRTMGDFVEVNIKRLSNEADA